MAPFWLRPMASSGRIVTARVPLVFSVLEDKAEFENEMSVFQRTLWAWLGGAGLLLLLSQTLLLRWGLAPLRRVAQEVRRIENGEQTEIEGRYPTEIAGLTGNLNTLIKQERARQTRYKDALDDLAHSLKTPLAVLRTALDEPAQLPAMVAQQVDRMDGIVQHQLGRAAASGAARFAPHLALAPVLHRIRDSLAKVYADKGLDFTVECPPDLSWRIDEGDAFEILGNVLDNAAKWASHRVEVRIWRDGGRLFIRIQDDGPGFSDAAGPTAASRAAGRTGARPRDRPGGGQRPGCQPSGRVEAFARARGAAHSLTLSWLQPEGRISCLVSRVLLVHRGTPILGQQHDIECVPAALVTGSIHARRAHRHPWHRQADG